MLALEEGLIQGIEGQTHVHMSVKGGGKAGVKELARKIYVGLFIRKVIDEVVSIDRDINAVDTSGRTQEVTQLSGCKKYWKKDILFSKGSFWFYGRDRLDGGFNNGESVSDG